MILTYVDASVLIAAARGTGGIAARALTVLDDPARRFAASEFLRLEVLPKALFHRRTIEATLYQGFFAQVSVWASRMPRCLRGRSPWPANMALRQWMPCI